MAHPNVAPFICRQLIQRFVTSNPSYDYIERVSQTFNAGLYTLPNGTVVGEGKKATLKATLAAILLDPVHLSETTQNDSSFGKIREPILRFTHWARVFSSKSATARYVEMLYDVSGPDTLFQSPFKSPSVFNFFRPSFMAPGSESSDQGLGFARASIGECQ